MRAHLQRAPALLARTHDDLAAGRDRLEQQRTRTRRFRERLDSAVNVARAVAACRRRVEQLREALQEAQAQQQQQLEQAQRVRALYARMLRVPMANLMDAWQDYEDFEETPSKLCLLYTSPSPRDRG